MYIIYNILIILVFIFVALPYFLYRLVVEKGFGHRFRQNMGLVRREEIAPVADTNCIWLHGASVGEMVAISPLVKEIKNLMPERKILVSAVTVGGYDMARQIMPEADAIINFPLDLPFVASSMVSRIRPGIFIMVETELWPNFLPSGHLHNGRNGIMAQLPAGHPGTEYPCNDDEWPYLGKIRK